MNEVNNEAKNAVIKTLAIIGFIAAIVVGLWIAVQIVRMVPVAFSSLASLVESINSPRTSITVAIEKNIVNSGEPFAVSWTTVRQSGTYVFSYRCAEGVSAEARDASGEITALGCEEELTLPSRDQTVDVIFASEKKRFTDVPMTISFVPEGESEAAFEKNALITVVNATIPQDNYIAVDDEADTATPSDDDSKDVGEIAGATVGGVGTTRTTPIVTSRTPVSDPNGFTDLSITYLGIGRFNETTNAFTPSATLASDAPNAVRFEVKNIGTKTSGEWNFKATLPTGGGFVYTSDDQAPLRPNERAVMILGFDDTAQPGNEKIQVVIGDGGDINATNNSFLWSVKIES